MAPSQGTGPAPQKCRLRSCAELVASSAARVEVAVADAAGADPAGGVMSWDPNVALVFHADCWRKACCQEQAMSRGELQLFRLARSTAEFFDSDDEMEAKACRAAEILRQCRSAVAFTGAGISTSAGLGDYRGKQGKWTREEQGSGTSYTTVYEDLRPTFAHEAVAKLVEMGHLAYVASQNADGLHHLSGIPYTKLSDVHGSAFTEYCPGCRARYVRDFYTPEDRAEDYLAGRLPGPVPAHIRRCRGCGSNHWTGRNCEACGEPLRDTVVSFGDGLEECVLRPAFEHASQADACLSLGSTMSIGPSNRVVTMHRGPLIACVRQNTEMDGLCRRKNGVRAYGDCDDFMHRVMLRLLGEGPFAEWKASLSEKQAEYNRQRPAAGKERGDIFVKKC